MTSSRNYETSSSPHEARLIKGIRGIYNVFREVKEKRDLKTITELVADLPTKPKKGWSRNGRMEIKNRPDATVLKFEGHDSVSGEPHNIDTTITKDVDSGNLISF